MRTLSPAVMVPSQPGTMRHSLLLGQIPNPNLGQLWGDRKGVREKRSRGCLEEGELVLEMVGF